MNTKINSCSAKSLLHHAPVKNSNGGVNNNAFSSLTSGNGEQKWLVASKFHEIGSPRQREATKTFASSEDARAFFDEKVAMFCKMFKHTPNASIKQGDTELQINVDGVQIVKMSYLAAPLQCA